MSNQVIGVLAGNGSLPKLISEYCINQNIKSYYAFIDVEPDFSLKQEYMITSIGKVGAILNFFKKSKVTHIILAGGVTKPNFHKLKVDFKGGILLSLILKNKLLGDNSLLTTIINYLEKFNYQIISVDDLLPNLHLSVGHNNNITFNKALTSNIDFGVELINNLSPFDVGQSVIIQNNRVIAIEAVEGTDNMIKRAKNLIDDNPQTPAILIKIKKISQTIKNLLESKIYGIILDAKNTIVIDKEQVAKFAEENKIFIYGIINDIN